MTMIWDILTREKKKDFISILEGLVEDWKDNPTLKIYQYVDWAYEPLKYVLKIQYRICDPRMDKRIEMDILQKHENTHVTMFRWPVPVADMAIAPSLNDYPSRINDDYIFVSMKMASFVARCTSIDDAKEIAGSVLTRWKK